jgi:RDD family
MTYPNPGEQSPFEKPGQPPRFGQPQYGQPQYGQPQYGQPQYGQPHPTQQFPQQQFGQQYQPVPPGYYPVFNSQNQQVLVPLASPGKRLGVYFLDILLAIVTLGIGYVIWILIVWGRGQTPGKQLTHMYYVNESTGRVADWGKSALRDFVIRGIVFEIIAFFTFSIGWFVGAFMTLNEQKNFKAGWDRMAGTVVIDLTTVPGAVN